MKFVNYAISSIIVFSLLTTFNLYIHIEDKCQFCRNQREWKDKIYAEAEAEGLVAHVSLSPCIIGYGLSGFGAIPYLSVILAFLRAPSWENNDKEDS